MSKFWVWKFKKKDFTDAILFFALLGAFGAGIVSGLFIHTYVLGTQAIMARATPLETFLFLGGCLFLLYKLFFKVRFSF